MVCDNFLQLKYFDYLDGRDNVFCSLECLAEALTVKEFNVPPDEEDELEENEDNENDLF